MGTWFGTLSAALLTIGCFGEEPPYVAELELTGTLTSNTCGVGGFDAADSFVESAVLRGYAGEDATFRWTDDDDALTGSATSAGVYTFTTTTNTVAITDATGATVCEIERRTRIVLEVTPPPTAPEDAGTDADLTNDGGVETASDVAYTVTGTYTEDLYTANGTNCAALRGENGGAYDTFPCRVSYSLEGGSL